MLDVDVRSLRDRVGQEIAVSDWMPIAQDRIQQFADATGDHQWIHVDAARAAVESPYKTTIAHGFLTLSLVSSFARSAMRFTGLRMAINYGLNRVRFPAPVLSGSRVRARFAVAAFDEPGDGVQITWTITAEADGASKPCLVGEWVVRYYPEVR
jgi:acyl dehydratase